MIKIYGREEVPVNVTDNMAAIILAAGSSFRMKEFRPLMKLGNVTAIEHAVRCFYYAGINDIRIVLGYNALDVIETLRYYVVRFIFNRRFHEEMFSSVREGIATLEPEIRAFFVMPADNPLVSVKTVYTMLERFHAPDQPDIVYPSFNNRRGHPPLISARLKMDIYNSSSPGGLREVLRNFESGAVDVAVDDEAVLLDMNVPDDYHRLLKYLKYQDAAEYK
ncbi:CTP:molybdopterin cytidylyltransferase [Desulfocucumis palustris]|uniref:CTP:molybdopterin cytidylyltransferase n=1 Tax=Desulfocucumis palustris TaxID=1898651 RepID=A0A2L2XG52_9FIRM|nr:nucleotidyltransferase family protein [Desulfocucumis palustris]GBF35185.1 CTP:molybdopterin cytidylyltransferase [Desulfocucumis palustris]